MAGAARRTGQKTRREAVFFSPGDCIAPARFASSLGHSNFFNLIAELRNREKHLPVLYAIRFRWDQRSTFASLKSESILSREFFSTLVSTTKSFHRVMHGGVDH